MRFLRTFAVAAVLAGVFTTSALALAFDDQDYFWPDGEVGTPYHKQLLGRTDVGVAGSDGHCHNKCKFVLIDGSLPPGITLNSDGNVSGTPTQLGSWSFWIQLRGVFGGTPAEREFTLKISSVKVTVTTNQSEVPAGSLGKPYNLSLSEIGTGQLAWSLAGGTLPDGLSFSNGRISGTPTKVGDYTFTVKLTDANNPQRSDTKTLTISVVEPLKLTAGPKRPVAEVGRPFSTTVKASGGKAPYAWQPAQLPDGFAFDPQTGVLSGQPTAPGTVTITLALKDALGTTSQLALRLRVADRLQLGAGALRSAAAGHLYSAKLKVAGGVRTFQWRVLRGKLPSGLRLDSRTGALAGVPRAAGTYRFTVRVRDALNAISTRTYVLSVR